MLVLGSFNSTASDITLEPSSQIVTTGENFTVDVFITPDTAIAGLQFDLEFDSSKIQIDSVSEGRFLSQNGASAFFNEGNIDNNAGILSDVYGSIIGPSSILGPESFAIITMSVKDQVTSTSTISLKNVIVSDPSGNPIDVLINDLTLTINEGPVAVANGPSEVNEGDILSFDASGSYDPNGVEITSYEWDFSDGTAASGLEVTHAYKNNGIYTATLTVTDDKGASASDTLTVTVNNVAPVVDAGPDQTANAGNEVRFSGNFDDPGILDTHIISWDFGDSEIAESALTPAHTYADKGVYNVILTITDNDGASTSDTATVTVAAPEINTISIDSTNMSVVENYNFWKWTRIYATAEVKIVDSTGSPIDGVVVSGQWSGTTSDSDSGVTDSNGKVTVDSKKVWGSGPRTFTFTVDGVSHNIQWDGETRSGTITYQ
ncbi:PKD domain-containing protein [Methanococcoides sp. AM1]|uniref:PKD domain-containing protein n=1 Tax=Methanococcoides sp. AM1 TaxID=1201011 RepID=UPI0010831D6B|nr:PKD domain-containing protein [Methanococcoides sp. AM1]